MASLRSATPKLRNYFRDNYIPQICEVLEPRGLAHIEGAGEARRCPELQLGRSGTGEAEGEG